MTDNDNKDPQITDGIIGEAYIVLTDGGDAYFIEGNTLHFFDSLSGNLIDAGLVVPEELQVGVYFCTNFHSVNHSYDRDSGVLDGWDVACTWELVWNKQQSEEPKQLRAERVGTEQKEDDEYNHPPLFGYRYSLVPDESIAEIRIGFSTVTHRDESLRAIKEMFKSKLTDSAQITTDMEGK